MKPIKNTTSKNGEMNVKEADKLNYGIKDPKEKYETEKEMIQRKDIENSPFTVITIGDESFGAMGKHRITEISLDRAGVEEELRKFSWNRVIQVMMLMMEVGINKIVTNKEEE